MTSGVLRPTVFLDRDGVINVDTGYPHREENLILTPTAGAAIARLNAEGCLVIVVTNQSGIARGLFGWPEVERFHEALQARLAAHGARIDEFYVAPYHKDGIVAPFNVEHEDRKPGAGMLRRAFQELPIDRSRCILVGDRSSDAQAARNAGIPSILVPSNGCDLADVTTRWLASLPAHRSVRP